jgi:hypothetical protein
MYLIMTVVMGDTPLQLHYRDFEGRVAWFGEIAVGGACGRDERIG